MVENCFTSNEYILIDAQIIPFYCCNIMNKPMSLYLTLRTYKSGVVSVKKLKKHLQPCTLLKVTSIKASDVHGTTLQN